jgi:hypothetical protein
MKKYFILFLLILPVVASARINLVTLPERDTVQLTIYNSADLTMVRETRYLSLRKGINRLEFSWANTLIDPTSLEFRPLQHADKVEVLDVRFPARVTNLLEWRINSEVAGEVPVEIRYFTSGIRWAADYVAQADEKEKVMALACNVRVFNDSGEDYENTQVRLVVGTIHLVEEIAELARRGRPAGMKEEMIPESPMVMKGLLDDRARAGRVMAMSADLSAAKPREIVKEGISEYFLYTVEGRDTIPTGWSKRLPSFRTTAVPLISYYKFEKERWGDAVMRYYRFRNDTASKLGEEPLPDGAVAAYRNVSKDGLQAFVGKTAVKYIPVGEQVDMELGVDPEVRVEAKLMEWRKDDLKFDEDGAINGWIIRERWQLDVQNSKEIPVTLDVRRNFTGSWSLETKEEFEKVDADTIKFVRTLSAGDKKTMLYEVTTRYGAQIRR